MTRALWASLGAGTSIVLMGVGVLAAVSTVVAFNGWPGASRGGGTTPSAMLAQGAPAPAIERVATTPRIVVPDASSRERREGARGARPTDAAGDTGSARVVPDTTSNTGTGTGTTPSRNVQGTTIAPKVPPVPKSVAEPVRQAGSELGSSTDQTVKDLGKAVEPISPTLSNAVGDVGQVVGDTVQGVTNTLSDVLDSVLAKPSP